MKLAIMQPYFLPYIGYFQLLNAVDKFVIYDNIQFTKKGWINRNRILENGKDAYITVSIVKDSDYLDVIEREVSPNFDKNRIINRVRNSYARAPHFKEAFPIIEKIINNPETNLFRYIYDSIVELSDYLSIDTELVISSSIDINHQERGEDKVLALCKAMNADTYINPIGGLELYSKDKFKEEGLNLNFIQTGDIKYAQGKHDFISSLSILDVMMFNSKEEISEMLQNYKLV